MAAKVSDVPNSKYHSLFFILGQRDVSASGLGAVPHPSRPQPSRWQDRDMGRQWAHGPSVGTDSQRQDGDMGHRWGGTASAMAQRDRGWLRQTLTPAPCGGEGCRCRVVPQHWTGASTRAERRLSSLNGASGDRVPRRGDVPHLSTLPAPHQAAPDHCSSPASIAVLGSKRELNFRAGLDTLGFF